MKRDDIQVSYSKLVKLFWLNLTFWHRSITLKLYHILYVKCE